VVKIGTVIPKSKIFRFGCFWTEQTGFKEVVQHAWNSEVRHSNSATKVAAKFKLLQRVLKRWAMNLSNLERLTSQCNEVLMILDRLEENRMSYPQERNFRSILKNQILKLLNFQKEYWRQRYTVRWTKLGDESTKFFHAAATGRYRINSIAYLDAAEGRTLITHEEKAAHV
jgi:hypothetical protein